MRYDDRPTARFVRAILAAFLLAAATSAWASETEQTLIVPPGADAVSLGLSPFVMIDDTYGPFHGQLIQTAEGLAYEPGDGFADARADIIIFALRNPNPEVLRIRVVAGAIALDGEVAILGDLTGLPPDWESWIVNDPAGELEIIQGLFGDAYVFDPADDGGPTLVIPIDEGGNSGNGTTTSATHLDVEVRDLPKRPLEVQGGMTFFQISDAGSIVGGLDAEWVDDELFVGWRVRPTSTTAPVASDSFELRAGVNRIAVRRWTNFDTSPAIGGLELFLNNIRVAQLPAAIHDLNGEEKHEILRTNVPGPGHSDLVVENVTAKRSENTVDPTERLSYDHFNGGVAGDWTLINPVAQSISPQDLPGSGDRLDLDLGLVAQGQSSYLEKPVPLPGGIVPDPPGFAFRLWIDPTAVSLKASTSVRVATACTEGGSCGPARIWLGYDGYDFTITATAWRDGGTAARIETTVTGAPHMVELRLRNGWLPGLANGSLELWIDGVLIGRESGIENHTAQINKLRIGILTDAGASSGVLGIDDYEAWRFEE